MNYPENLKIGDTIGICAPSDGIVKPEKQIKLDAAIYHAPSSGRSKQRFIPMCTNKNTNRNNPTHATRIFLLIEAIFGKFMFFLFF